MSEPADTRVLIGWQRAHVLSAAQYLRDVTLKTPGDDRARAVYEGLLDVLEPARRVARQHGERHAPAAGSMWDRRSGDERRHGDRRTHQSPGVKNERRRADRRGGRDRRNP